MAILFVPGFMTDETIWDDCIEAFRPLGPIQHVDTSLDASIEEIAAARSALRRRNSCSSASPSAGTSHAR